MIKSAASPLLTNHSEAMNANSEGKQMFRHLGHKLCPKIILEGTRMTKKTELAFALNEHPHFIGPRKYRYHSPIISAEWGGFTNAPWGEGLINFEKEKEAWALRTYELWIQLLEHLPFCSWIVDRFYMSTQVHQWIFHHRRYDFRWLEARLKALGFRLVFCYRRPETFLEARNERLKISGNPSQYCDLARIIREQEELYGAFRDSQLEKLTVDITDRTVATAADEIVAWLEQSGALWVDDKLTNPCMLVDSGEERDVQQCVWADTNADFGPKSSVSDADPGDYLT